MRDACSLVWSMLALLFRSRASLEAEILILRHQLNIQRRHLPKRPIFNATDRLIFVALYRPQRVDACEAGHRHPLASCRVQIVLALEVTTSFRSTDGSCRNTTADPRDEHCQSAVGSAADPWRVAQAGHRDRPDQRRQVYGQAKGPAVPRLEDLPPQPCRRHRGNGSVRRADDLISTAVRPVDHEAWSTTDFMVGRHRASDRGMDCQSAHGSLLLRPGSPPSYP
jgi:hypothetical protein